MFASLKNKIREEIGSDVSTVVRNAGSIRNINSKHLSRTESSSSVSESQISLDESFDSSATISSSPAVQYKTDNNFYDIKLTDGLQLTPKDYKKLENREIEWKRKLIKKDHEYQKKIDKKDDECRAKIIEKEKEWKKLMDKQEKDKLKLEDDKLKAESARRTLELALRDAEEYKKKLHSFQEDAEQLEGFQTQEMAKIKHLLLSKEQEVDEKSHHLKSALSEIENLKSELSRLRRYEDELNNVQKSSAGEIQSLKTEKAKCLKQYEEAKIELEQLRIACNAEKENNSSLNIQLARIRENLESERVNSATLRINFEQERNEKDSILLRNAQVSQDYEIALQKKRQQEIENIELQNKIDNLEKKLLSYENIETDKKNNEGLEKTLRSNLSDLEEQLNEKTKTIKVLQQRLGDMKKTLQRELRVPSSSFDSDIDQSAAILSPSSSKTITAKNSSTPDDDVNFKYLKHVLIKFLTSREYEALHLTRAVATLLHFSPEEEKLLQETLEWKMSWFGSRPNLGIGQTANSIPPS